MTAEKFADRFTNRELSWLEFNKRILDEARDKTNPLMERVKFLSITASNLDEFFMVRVGSLTDMLYANYSKLDIAGMTVREQLVAIHEKAHALVDAQYETLKKMLVPALAGENLSFIMRHEDLTLPEAEYVDTYFMEKVYPVLTPMAVDSSRPFPLIRNKSLNIAALIENIEARPLTGEVVKKKKKHKEGEEEEKEALYDFATVQVPAGLPRLVRLPSEKEERYIFLEEIIKRNIQKLFMNFKVICSASYRITRNADLSIDEDDAADLLKEIEKQIKRRQWGRAIRLEIEDGADERLVHLLAEELNLPYEGIYPINGPLDLTFCMKAYGVPGFENLKQKMHVPKASPQIDPEKSIFANIRKGDILLHHPYESFDPVVGFIKAAADDEKVLAIKQTLYRLSGNSPIIAALAKAADNGKQVTVLVELKARFDEENNINWARMLEKAGCHVIYGLVGLKTHSKITLIVRQEEEGIIRYVHLGTGNYNDSTAKLYTDVGLLTCNRSIGEDATAVFNMLSGYSEPLSWNKLIVAPIWMRDRLVRLIDREIRHAKEGRKGAIIAKMNSLCDAQIIEKLYEASAAGVSIDLIVRGICCLKAGVEGLSENIRVRSIVGTYLEHSRIFYFYHDGIQEVYCGSADWMPRNLDRRVEIMFPVEAPELKERLIGILETQLKDNVKASILLPDGSYKKEEPGDRLAFCAQEYFCKEADEKAVSNVEEKDPRIFVPKMTPDSQ